jgi:hypothetical protein
MLPVTFRLAIAVLLLVVVPGSSAAQLAGAGTGSIVGVVTDATGARVPDVEITISGPAVMEVRRTASLSDGEYRVGWLPPGEYVLVFAAPGFERQPRRARVGLGFTLRLDVTMAVALSEDMVVRGALDPHTATVSQSFDQRMLPVLPGSRSLAALFSVTPGILLQAVEVGGGTGMAGGSSTSAYGRNNSPRHTIEGISVTGLFGFGFSPDYGALEEVSVLTAGHGAEWSTSGIHTDITTKSGSNTYRGSVYGAGEHRRLQSSNIDADQIGRDQRAGGTTVMTTEFNRLWRNADFNADGGGFVRKDRLWWYASARRQEVAARVVNFPVEPYLTTLTNYSGKVTLRLWPGHKLVLYGQRGFNHQPHRLDPFGPGGGLSATTAINESRGSTLNQRNSIWLWKGEWNAILGESVLFEIRAGQFRTDSLLTPRSSEPRFEDIELLQVRGGNRHSLSKNRRSQLNGTVSYFTQNRTGRHHFRFGAEALRLFSTEDSFLAYPGNVLHVLRSGRPASVIRFEAPASSAAGSWNLSAYASDAWQVGRRLTLTLGLRGEVFRLFLPQQSHTGRAGTVVYDAIPNLAGWKLVNPRVSAVFDLTGDGTTLAKVNFGRFRAIPNASLAFNLNPNAAPWWKQFVWLDANQNGVWENGEQGREESSRGGDAIDDLDSGLDLPVLDEAGAWIERTLWTDVTIRTGAVLRLERSNYARQNINQPFEAFTVPVLIPDRGPDGVAGTADDGPGVTAFDLSAEYAGQPTINKVRNVPGASNRYLSWEVAATRQLRDGWSFGASFTHTWNGDHAANYSGQSVRNNTYAVTPNDLIHTRSGSGGRYEYRSWTAKAYGTFEGPWRLRITPVLRHQSGQPFGRTQRTERNQLSFGTITVLMEPIGTRRLDHITLVDVRFERTVRLKAGRVAAFIDVFNCLNANPETNVVFSSGAAFLRPLAIVSPRIARFGLTFDW